MHVALSRQLGSVLATAHADSVPGHDVVCAVVFTAVTQTWHLSAALRLAVRS